MQIIGPVMTLQHELEQGLEINWNFNGLVSDRTFQTYHVFIFFKGNLGKVRKLIEIYYSEMKFGDLIGICEQNESQNGDEKVKWNEKTAFAFNQKLIKKRNLLQKIDAAFISNIFRVISKLNGLVFINILLSSSEQEQDQQQHNLKTLMRNLLSQSRKSNQKMDKIIVNFISEGSQTNKMNFLEGVNNFYFHGDDNTYREEFQHEAQSLSFKKLKQIQAKTTSGSLQNLCMLLKKLKKLGARIYLKGESIYSHSNTDWTYIDNEECLQKIYYSIPAFNFKQNFLFFTKQSQKSSLINLSIVLDCSFYDGTQLQAKGNLFCSFDKQCLNGKTYGKEKHCAKFTEIPGVREIMINLCGGYNYVCTFHPYQKDQDGRNCLRG